MDKLIIELSEEQTKKFEDWKKSFKKLPYLGAIGGHFKIEIMFTSIGEFVTGIAWNGKTIDLTEHDKI